MAGTDVISCRISIDHREFLIMIVIATKKTGRYASVISEQFLEEIINGQQNTIIAAQGYLSRRFDVTDEMKTKCADVLATLSNSRAKSSPHLDEFNGEDARLILGMDPNDTLSPL